MAKDFGVVGKTYPIVEPDMMVQMQQRLQSKIDSGELDQLHQQWAKRAQGYVQRPTGKSLPQARVARVSQVQTQLTLQTDLKDEQGHTLYAKGTSVNPLNILSLPYALCFFDGDDPQQVIWIQQHCAANPLNKLVLVNGNYVALSERTGLRLYFDQRGLLTERLDIRALPAVLQQRGEHLYVEEIPLF